MRALVVIAVVTVVLAVLFTLVERRFAPAGSTPWTKRPHRTDLVYLLGALFVGRAPVKLAVGIAVGIVAGVLGTARDAESVKAWLARDTWASHVPPAVEVLLALLAADFCGYWLHRAFHRGRLWRIHAVHHSSEPLDWLSAFRVHPLNEIIQRTLVVVPLVLLGFHPLSLGIAAPIVGLYAILIHANVTWDLGPLRWVITTPRFHRWHHTSQSEGRDKNFAGIFPLWDLVFGTFYMPKDIPRVFGVDEPVPRGFLAQLAYPFRAPPPPT